MDGLSPETRALLDRANEGDRLDEARSDALRRRTAAALGVVGPAIPRSAISTHGAPGWVLRLFGALGATGAAVVVVAHLHGAPAPTSIASRAKASPATVMSVTATVSSAAVGSEAEPAPGAPGAPAAVASRPPATTVVRANPSRAAASRSHDSPAGSGPAPVADSLAAETRLVAAAQSALDRGQGARALSSLDEHDRRFPGGALAPESAALRVEALCAVGRGREARAEALRWSVSHPASPPRRLPLACSRE